MDPKCGKYFFLLLLIIGLGFVLYTKRTDSTENMTEEIVPPIKLTSLPTTEGEIQTQVQSEQSSGNSTSSNEDMYLLPNDYSPPESDWLSGKFNGRNKAYGKYKSASYSSGRRGALSASEWNAYFDSNNNIIGNGLNDENDKFLPIDEANNGYMAYQSNNRETCGSNQDCDPEDMFDPDKVLPQEINQDWFEVQPEPISVKNRHLINVTRPLGVGTIGNSKRNQSYDIRGAPLNPRFVVSPWLQSNIEPDNNHKPLF